jgi:hypothetical protein
MPVESLIFFDKTSKNYILRYNFGFPVKDIVADDYVLEIVFPTFANDFKISMPFNIDKEENKLFYGILDFVGRPVKLLHKK